MGDNSETIKSRDLANQIIALLRAEPDQVMQGAALGQAFSAWLRIFKPEDREKTAVAFTKYAIQCASLEDKMRGELH